MDFYDVDAQVLSAFVRKRGFVPPTSKTQLYELAFSLLPQVPFNELPSELQDWYWVYQHLARYFGRSPYSATSLNQEQLNQLESEFEVHSRSRLISRLKYAHLYVDDNDYLTAMPLEMLTTILSNLDLSLLNRALMVNQQLNILSQETSFWRTLIKIYAPFLITMGMSLTQLRKLASILIIRHQVGSFYFTISGREWACKLNVPSRFIVNLNHILIQTQDQVVIYKGLFLKKEYDISFLNRWRSFLVSLHFFLLKMEISTSWKMKH